MATFAAHTASPPPPSRTPAGSRASSRRASIAPRTTWAHGPLTWAAPRTRTHRSIPAPPTPADASNEQSLTRLPLELLNGLPPDPRDVSPATRYTPTISIFIIGCFSEVSFSAQPSTPGSFAPVTPVVSVNAIRREFSATVDDSYTMPRGTLEVRQCLNGLRYRS